MKKTLQKILLFTFLYQTVFGQIEITFPKNRIVFQRNNQNSTTFSVAGYFKTAMDRIDARLIPVIDGQGIATDWTTIVSNPSNSSFNGKITGTGGWYKLELRGYYDSQIVAISSVEKVGIGEVFIVSGQSNAQGDPIYAGATEGTQEDRVSVIDFYDPIFDESKLPFEFSQMKDNTKMAPYHYVPYFWSKLGEKLVQKYNVPVLFYGTALGGIGSSTWQRSAAGEDLRKELPIFISTAGMPYKAMKAALNLYAARTGVRSILWLQGESDNYSSTDFYFNNLKYVIEKTRADLNKPDLAWMIARNTVPYAQNLLINQIPNTFAGPITDEIDGPDLRDKGHFAGLGLWAVANSYMSYLTDSFFQSTNPHLPNFIQDIKSNCNTSNGTITASLPAGYQNYTWNNNANSQTISFNNLEGIFNGKMTDNKGNLFITSSLYIPLNYYHPNGFINISPSGKTEFCKGNEVNINSYSTNIFNFNWSNGAKKRNISVNTSGTYFASGSSIAGCSFTTNKISVNVLPKPIKPIITALGNTQICKGYNVILKSTDAHQYSWNNGQTSNQIAISQSGNFSVKVIDKNGCVSDTSNNIPVTILPQPSPPSIYAVPDTIACQGSEISVLSSSNQPVYWSNTSITNRIKVKENGLYSARNKNNFGCFSEYSKPISVSFKAVPTIIELNQIGTYSLEPKIINNIKADKFEWYYEGQLLPVETSILKAINDGKYSVKALNIYGKSLTCSSLISNTFLLANRNLFENNLSLYPNPTINGIVTLETAEKRSNVTFEIIKENGTLQDRYFIGELNDKTIIDLSKYGRGFYIIKIYSNEGSQVKRVLYN